MNTVLANAAKPPLASPYRLPTTLKRRDPTSQNRPSKCSPTGSLEKSVGVVGEKIDFSSQRTSKASVVVGKTFRRLPTYAVGEAVGGSLAGKKSIHRWRGNIFEYIDEAIIQRMADPDMLIH